MILLLLLNSFLCHAFLTDYDMPIDDAKNRPQIEVLNKTFENYIDHLATNNMGKFKQRYFVVEENWNRSKSPVIILNLCGESECKFSYTRLFPYEISRYFKGVFIAIEHRFYGYSHPMPDLSLESLKYLNHEQALADYAYFIESIEKDYTINNVRPTWIVVGGSYAGALAAWFRYKYPHLVTGALASSAVVKPIIDFYQFDKQVADDFKDQEMDCYHSIAFFHTIVEDRLTRYGPEKRLAFIKRFTNDTNITNEEFMFYFADVNVLFPQYSKTEAVCKFIKEIRKKYVDSIDLQLEMYGKEAAANGTNLDYYTYKLKRNTTLSPRGRQWAYQFCTTYAWFQTPDKTSPLRFKAMDVNYWINYCKNAIGTDAAPDIEHVNSGYGEELITKYGSNIFFTQSKYDPWRWAGINNITSNNTKIELGINDCKDCGHCRELQTPDENDPNEVKEVRKRIIEAITKWIQ